ncbi:MAG: tRNA dihydrouridine(20/20a) synthase DusA [Succinivibrio sp.]|nr:tRNA dihydrouridine(20/20a) synthase DusA [Succinivibrio sp.]
MSVNSPFLEAELFSVAPMVDVTNSAFRRVARVFTKRAMLYTEMIAAEALCHGKTNLIKHAGNELPCVLQLGGSDPRRLALAAKIGEDFGYSCINLNAGCPSDKVQQGRFGAVLMKDPDLIGQCVSAMMNAVSIPVSVKTRIGVDEFDNEDFTRYLIGTIFGYGCRHVIIHARKCWLEGLSPKENRTVPPLDYDRVYNLKNDFPDLNITINGGITDLCQCVIHLNHVEGVMLGRAVIDNPYLLAGVDHELFGDDAPVKSREQCFYELLDLAETFLSEGHKLQHLAIHVLNLFAGCPGARNYRRYLSEHMTQEHAGVEVLEKAYAAMQ